MGISRGVKRKKSEERTVWEIFQNPGMVKYIRTYFYGGQKSENYGNFCSQRSMRV